MLHRLALVLVATVVTSIVSFGAYTNLSAEDHTQSVSGNVAKRTLVGKDVDREVIALTTASKSSGNAAFQSGYAKVDNAAGAPGPRTSATEANATTKIPEPGPAIPVVLGLLLVAAGVRRRKVTRLQ